MLPLYRLSTFTLFLGVVFGVQASTEQPSTTMIQALESAKNKLAYYMKNSLELELETGAEDVDIEQQPLYTWYKDSQGCWHVVALTKNPFQTYIAALERSSSQSSAPAPHEWLTGKAYGVRLFPYNAAKNTISPEESAAMTFSILSKLAEKNGRPVATRVGWIGTADTYRRRGIARTLLDICVHLSQKHKSPCIKLKSTDMGLPLYTGYGFIKDPEISSEKCLILPMYKKVKNLHLYK